VYTFVLTVQAPLRAWVELVCRHDDLEQDGLDQDGLDEDGGEQDDLEHDRDEDGDEDRVEGRVESRCRGWTERCEHCSDVALPSTTTENRQVLPMVVTGTAGQTDGRLHGPVLDSVTIAVSSRCLDWLAITTLCLRTEPIDEVLLERQTSLATSLNDCRAVATCSIQ
jgi:hypothetical protein